MKTTYEQVSRYTYIDIRDKTYSPFLTYFNEKELSGSRMWLSIQHKGLIGYAIDSDNELFGLFNNSGIKGLGKSTILDAIKNGADKLFCFDGYLPKLYAQFGFIITDTASWDEAFAPDKWDYAKYGRPNVVWMKLK